MLLFRHAAAEPATSTGADADRELTKAGRQQLQRTAAWLLERERLPDLILHSPYRRTTQTASVLAEELGLEAGRIRPAAWMAPDAGSLVDALCESLRRMTHDRVLAVGHQPAIGRAASMLTGGSHIAFSPGSVACIRLDSTITAGHGVLEWLLAASLFGGGE